LILNTVDVVSGAVFVTAFAAYAVVRQILLRLRVEQRKSARTVSLTGIAAGVVVVVVLVLTAAQGG